MGTARLEIVKTRTGWVGRHPYGETWGTSFYHGPTVLKRHTVDNFLMLDKGRHDDYAVLIETETGWF
jgi:hypothetical protein